VSLGRRDATHGRPSVERSRESTRGSPSGSAARRQKWGAYRRNIRIRRPVGGENCKPPSPVRLRSAPLERPALLCGVFRCLVLVCGPGRTSGVTLPRATWGGSNERITRGDYWSGNSALPNTNASRNARAQGDVSSLPAPREYGDESASEFASTTNVRPRLGTLMISDEIAVHSP